MERQRTKNVLHANQARKFDAEKLHETRVAGPVPPPASGALTTAKVAKGRTLHLPDPNVAPELVSYATVLIDGTSTLKPITHQPIKVYGPGTVVELPASEISRLRNLGFLEHPDKHHVTNAEASLATGVRDDARLAAGPVHDPQQRDEDAAGHRTRMSP